MKLPPCDKRRLDRSTGIAMCYAIGCCEVGDMPCECEGCLASHGGKCPEGKDGRRKPKAKRKKRRVSLHGYCAECAHAEDGSYIPMYVGDRWSLWGTVRCMRNKRPKRVYALNPTDCKHYHRRARVP